MSPIHKIIYNYASITPVLEYPYLLVKGVKFAGSFNCGVIEFKFIKKFNQNY